MTFDIFNCNVYCKQGKVVKSLLIFRKAREQLQVQDDGKYGDITTVRDKFGRDPSLPAEIEKLLKLFLEHCNHIGVPRSRGRCARDIQEMVIQEKIPVPRFVYNKPGNYLMYIFDKAFDFVFYHLHRIHKIWLTV